jgi:hypothetical protein
MRDILDNVVDARLSKEAKISALRREVAVERTKLLAILHGCLTQPRGCAVAKHDVDWVSYGGEHRTVATVMILPALASQIPLSSGREPSPGGTSLAP